MFGCMNVPHFMYPLIVQRRHLCCFHFVWSRFQYCCYEHLCIIVSYGCAWSFLLGTCLGGESLSHMFNVVTNYQTGFQKDRTIFHPVSTAWGFSFPHVLANTVFSFHLSVKCYFIIVLICISLMTNYVKHVLLFSCTYWPFVYVLWRNVFASLSSIFQLCCVF